MPIDPGSLSNVRGWVRAKDISWTSGALTWPDRSPLAHNFSGTGPTLVTGQTPSSGPVVRFSGSPFLTAVNGMAAGERGEVWAVVRNASTATMGFPFMAASNQDTRYPFGSEVYHDWCTGNTRDVITGVSGLNSWKLMRILAKANGDVLFYLDNTLLHTFSGGTTPTWLSNWYLGTGPSQAWTGDMAEWYVRRAESTSTEVGYLIEYFNAEHGLSVPGAGTYVNSISAAGMIPV